MQQFDPSSYSFDSVALNIVVVWIIQRLKLASSMSWISDATPKVTKIVSVVAATLTSAGMSVNWDASGGVLTISGISAGAVVLFVWLTIKNVCFQHIIYHTAFKPSDSKQAV